MSDSEFGTIEKVKIRPRNKNRTVPPPTDDIDAFLAPTVSTSSLPPDLSSDLIAQPSKRSRDNQSGSAIGGSTIDPIVRLEATIHSSAQSSTATDSLAESGTGTGLGAVTVRKMGVETTVDHAMDICKDYLKFGWCQWGDTCKYLHDRSAQRSSAQLDIDYTLSIQQQAQSEQDRRVLVIPADLQVPETCQICGNALGTPAAMTICKHFFCEKCVLQRFSTDKTCATCGTDTKGKFTGAIAELARRRAKIEELTHAHNQMLHSLTVASTNTSTQSLFNRL